MCCFEPIGMAIDSAAVTDIFLASWRFRRLQADSHWGFEPSNPRTLEPSNLRTFARLSSPRRIVRRYDASKYTTVKVVFRLALKIIQENRIAMRRAVQVGRND